MSPNICFGEPISHIFQESSDTPGETVKPLLSKHTDQFRIANETQGRTSKSPPEILTGTLGKEAPSFY